METVTGIERDGARLKITAGDVKYIPMSEVEKTTVSGDNVFIHIDPNNNDNRSYKQIVADYNNVTTPTESSASALQAVVDALIQGGAVVTSGITANAGGGQANAVELDNKTAREGYHEISTVGSAGDSVKLESQSEVGVIYHVSNNAGANAADVFPPSGGDLGAGADTAVSLAAGASATFVCTAADTFERWL